MSKWRDRAITAGLVLFVGGLFANALLDIIDKEPQDVSDDPYVCTTLEFAHVEQVVFLKQELVASMEYRGASVELWENPETFDFSLIWIEPDYGYLGNGERISCRIISGRIWHLPPANLEWDRSPPETADGDRRQQEY